MKKIASVVILLFCITASVFAQDIIVTSQGDTIPCKIFKIKKGYIYYGHLVNKRPIRSIIDATYVTFYQVNYYSNRDIVKYFPEEDWGRGRFAFDGSYSYRPGSVSEDASDFEKKYYRKLKTGYGYSVELSYFFTKHIGAGMFFNMHRSYYRLGDVGYYDTNGNLVVTGELSTDISIPLFGPEFCFTTKMMKGKLNYTASACIGYMKYTEKWKAPYDGTIVGDTVGVALHTGLEYKISPSVAVGVSLSIVSGVLSHYTVDDGQTKQVYYFAENEYQGIAHIDFSVGLRIYFAKRKKL